MVQSLVSSIQICIIAVSRLPVACVLRKVTWYHLNYKKGYLWRLFWSNRIENSSGHIASCVQLSVTSLPCLATSRPALAIDHDLDGRSRGAFDIQGLVWRIEIWQFFLKFYREFLDQPNSSSLVRTHLNAYFILNPNISIKMWFFVPKKFWSVLRSQYRRLEGYRCR